MNKAYLAAPIFNTDQLRVVKAIYMTLKFLEFGVFSPYHASQPIWKGRAPKDCSKEERDLVLRGNIENLHWADVLVCWVGGTDNDKTDTGVVWEMGDFFNELRWECCMCNTEEEGWRPCPPNLCEIVHPRHTHGRVPFTLAYIDPTDNRQHMNLMLAGTVDAVCYGPAQLHKALEQLRAEPFFVNHGDSRLMDSVREQFHPDKHLLHEKEPII